MPLSHTDAWLHYQHLPNFLTEVLIKVVGFFFFSRNQLKSVSYLKKINIEVKSLESRVFLLSASFCSGRILRESWAIWSGVSTTYKPGYTRALFLIAWAAARRGSKEYRYSSHVSIHKWRGYMGGCTQPCDGSLGSPAWTGSNFLPCKQHSGSCRPSSCGLLCQSLPGAQVFGDPPGHKCPAENLGDIPRP